MSPPGEMGRTALHKQQWINNVRGERTLCQQTHQRLHLIKVLVNPRTSSLLQLFRIFRAENTRSLSQLSRATLRQLAVLKGNGSLASFSSLWIIPAYSKANPQIEPTPSYIQKAQIHEWFHHGIELLLKGFSEQSET